MQGTATLYSAAEDRAGHVAYLKSGSQEQIAGADGQEMAEQATWPTA